MFKIGRIFAPPNIRGFYPETKRQEREFEQVPEKSVDRPILKPPLKKV